MPRFPAYVLPLLFGGCGLIIGSFLNVVAYRAPRGESIVTPRSRCTACGVAILPRDNVPTLSWLFPRGRRRSCGVTTSARYAVVEGITGVAFAALAARLGLTVALPVCLTLAASLVTASAIAVEGLRAPSSVVVVPLTFVGVVAVASAVAGDWERPTAAVLGAVVAWILAACTGRILAAEREMLLVIGFFLGWFGLETAAIGAGFVIAAVVAGWLLSTALPGGGNDRLGLDGGADEHAPVDQLRSDGGRRRSPCSGSSILGRRDNGGLRSQVTMIAMSCGTVLAVLLAGTVIPIATGNKFLS